MLSCRRAFCAVRAIARSMRWRSSSLKPANSPMKRSRTPWACSSSTSLSSARRNNPIKALTSSSGRCQFSLEKANRVSASTPWRTQPSITSRTALRPALWPKLRGWKRALAQRPLPSITMAMWRGTRAGAFMRAGAGWAGKARAASSDAQQLVFLVLDHRVDVLDEAIGQLLDLVVGLALFVFGDLLFLEQILDLLQGVAADVADGDLGVLALVAHVLGQLAAALFGERRHVEADHRAGGGRRDADVRGHQRLLDHCHQALLERRDDDRARIAQRHRGDLVQRHVRAVVGHLDVVHQRGAGAAGAQAGQVVLEGIDALAHAGLGIVLDVVDHGSSSDGSG